MGVSLKRILYVKNFAVTNNSNESVNPVIHHFLDSGSDASVYTPTIINPENNVIIEPSSRFLWTIKPFFGGAETHAIQFRIVDMNPPYAIVFDSILDQRDRYDRFHYYLEKLLPPGRKFAWSVRVKVGDKFGHFAPVQIFETLVEYGVMDLCYRMNGIGSTKDWVYGHKWVRRETDIRVDGPPDYFDSSATSFRFTTQDVRRNNDTLLFGLTTRLGSQPESTDSFCYVGCNIYKYDIANSSWLDMQAGSNWIKHPSVDLSPPDWRKHFLHDSLLYWGDRHYRWKKYRGNILLEVTWNRHDYWPPGTSGTGYPQPSGLVANATYLEGIGLISWSSTVTWVSRYFNGSSKSDWQLQTFGGQSYDSFDFQEIPQSQLPITTVLKPNTRTHSSRELPRFMSLHHLASDRSWVRAELYDVAGNRLAVFQDQSSVISPSFPVGVYMLRVQFSTGKGTYLISR